MRCLKCLSAALLVTSAVGVAVAAPWEHAGSKIIEQGQTTVSRRAYSYAPASAAPAQTAVSVAPAAAPVAAAPSSAATVQTQPRSYRSYSYQPGTNYRRANNNNRNRLPFYDRADSKVQFRYDQF